VWTSVLGRQTADDLSLGFCSVSWRVWLTSISLAPRPCLPLLLTAVPVGSPETFFMLVPLPVGWPDFKIWLFRLVVG